MSLLDGRRCAKIIEKELYETVCAMQTQPKLVILFVGSDPNSKTFVSLKEKACKRVGIYCELLKFPDASTYKEIAQEIQTLNFDQSVHGILLQLPLPLPLKDQESHLSHLIAPEKDVDGLHPFHFSQLAKPDANRTQPFFAPCTPAGCLELLDRNGINVLGKDTVILGRGSLVGLPLSLMLLQRQATVTICHSQTQNLPDKVKSAEILFVAIGSPEFIQKEWLRPNVVIVDVGVNYIDDKTSQKGYKVVGDVAFQDCQSVASAITPVPGGIGPMTIAMLLKNVVQSAQFVAGCQ